MSSVVARGPTIGRPPRIDRAAVIAAACDLLDEEGLAGLSMARLGRRLGVTAMAPYRHVADRDDLERAIVDHVLADLLADWQPGADWRADVRTWMERVRDHWLQHPWIGRLIGGGHSLSPPWLAALGRLAFALEAAGLPPDRIAAELVQISRVVVGVTMLEVQAPLPHTDTFRADRLGELGPDERERWLGLAPAIAAYGNDDFFESLVTQTIARLAT